MISQLKQLYKRQMFFPNWIGIFVNPFFFARAGLRDAISEFAPNLSGDLLDIGCGSKPYHSLFNVHSYLGLELDSETARKKNFANKFYDGVHFPFSNESFDSALCNQVLEHVFNPDIFLSEIARVLKPGGKLLLTVPFVWDEHEQPYDYARYSSFGLRALLEKQGFNYIEYKKLGADPSCLFQLINAYLYKVINNWPRPAKLLFTITIMATINILGLIARAILPRNPDLFLDHVVLAEKLK